MDIKNVLVPDAESSDEEYESVNSLQEFLPKDVAPMFDPLKCEEPIPVFDDVFHATVYGSHSNLDSETRVPNCPTTFADQYLYPTLAQNEHTRLTTLWYYTRGLSKDKAMLRKLDRMLDLVKQSLDWDIGIIGLLDARTYTRVATANVPIVKIPRREGTCSHTVNQHPGSVFSVTDMSQDWRFMHSPHVEVGGLRSYAGTQIRLTLHSGENVSLGSLCIASTSVQEPLTEVQKKTLIGAANMIAGEIVAGNRLRRLKERQTMVDVLTQLRANDNERDIESAAVEAILQRYPGARVGVTRLQDDSFEMDDKGPIPFSSIKAGLWEDANFINDLFQHFGSNEQVIAEHPVRAVVGQITPKDRLLLLSSTDLRLVFDDLDSWFIDQCAQIINTASQARALREALTAKDKFLRTVTHELRTPIHGILSSVELLGEEFKTRSLVRSDGPSSPSQDGDASLKSMLQTIRRSGVELMTTVNNILRLNTLTNENLSAYPTDYDLRCLEADVLGEVLGTDGGERGAGLSIRFERTFSNSMATVRIDADLLKELIKCLVCNAISATKSGSIEVIASMPPEERTLRFDVIDTGSGIGEIDQQRVFQAFEKLDIHSKGAGLGLSLAGQMASMLNGRLSLISSALGVGSHFRLELPHTRSITRSTIPLRQWSSKIHNLPSKYHTVVRSKHDLHLLSHLENDLLRRGLRKSDVAQDSLIITNLPDAAQEDAGGEISALDGPHAVLVVTSEPLNEDMRQLTSVSLGNSFVLPVNGPLFTGRIDEILSELDASYSRYCKLALHSRGRSPTHHQLRPSAQVSDANASETPPTTPALELDLSALSTPGRRTLKTLLVDDNNINLKVLELWCRKRNIPYGSADNGHKAVTQYCISASGLCGPHSEVKSVTDAFTLILMDLQMPECDGVEAVKRIRQHEKEHRLPPAIIFMITGQDSVNDRKSSFEAGVDDFYVKPVSLKKLDRAVAQWFPNNSS